MAGRRANGEGGIYRKGRYWEAVITKGYDSNGKQRFKYFSAKTQQEAKRKLEEYKELIKKGCYIETSKQTVGEWLDTFYEAFVVDKVKISTRVSDEAHIKNHLKPNLGGIKLNELKGQQVQEVYKKLHKNGRVDGKGGLSPKMVRNIHLTLNKALERAVKDDLIVKNPLKYVILPRREKKEIEILTPDEQKRLVLECPNHIWGMAILLTLYSGMRMGEVLGLKWSDIDFEKNTIRINKQLARLKDYDVNAKMKTKLALRNGTKTSSSNRSICIAPVIMEKLKGYKLKQEEGIKKWGKAYNNLNMVFCREDGQLIDPGTFRDFYLNTLKKANVAHKTFHALRHTFATRALESGVSIKVVSEILGHASIQITLDTYSHVSEELQQDAMQKIVDNFLDT